VRPRSNEISGTYDRLASSWDAWSGAVTPPLREAYTAQLVSRLQLSSRVLELGCGSGIPVARDICDSGHRYIGVDISQEMLRLATRQVRSARFVRADMATVAFRPARFDAVAAFYTIVHVDRHLHPAIYANVATWLRPGGVFIAAVSRSDVELEHDPDWLGAGPTYWSGYSAATNLGLLRDAGFEIESSEVVPQKEQESDVAFHWIIARMS
jgi:SAM-dependent methyltransferase